MSQLLILNDVTGAISTLSLNRPEKLNAINGKLLAAFCEALRSTNANKAIKVIILKGEGRAFCAGADLNDEDINLGADEATIRAEIDVLQEITRQILFSNKIVIGAIHGWAVGAGLEWAINCDFPIWTESAKGFFPEAKWGLSVTGAVTTLLPALVGPIKARDLILLGEKQSAEEFHRLGIAWKVVPDTALDEEALTLANRLSTLSSRSLADLKRGIQLGSYADIEKALAYETECCIAASMDQQTLENINTFSNT